MLDNYTVPLEKDFQKALLKKLRTLPNSWWVKINDRVTVGVPDILGCVAGIFVALELKTKTKLAPIQAYTLKKIDRAGGQSFVVTPANEKEVLGFLLKLSNLGRSPQEKGLESP